MIEVDLKIDVPNLAAHWMMGNLATLLADLGDRWPGCARDLTDELAIGLLLSQSMYNLNTAAVAEQQRIRANEAMAAAFDEVDFVIAATNPGTAFRGRLADEQPVAELRRLGEGESDRSRRLPGSDGRRPARGRRVPEGAVGGARLRHRSDSPIWCAWARSRSSPTSTATRPCRFPVASSTASVGMQVLTRHHADELLFDVAFAAEREMPWPKVASQRCAPDRERLIRPSASVTCSGHEIRLRPAGRICHRATRAAQLAEAAGWDGVFVWEGALWRSTCGRFSARWPRARRRSRSAPC